MAHATAIGTALDIVVKAVNIANGLRNLAPSNGFSSSGSESSTPQKKAEVEQDGPDVGHDASQNEVEVEHGESQNEVEVEQGGSGAGHGASHQPVRAEQDGPGVRHDASEEDVGVGQDKVGADHPLSDVRVVPQGIPKALDVPACVLALFSKGAKVAICGGVDALPVDSIRGFDAVVGALTDKAIIQGAPEIKMRLGQVMDACGRVLEDIREADESEEKCFPDRTLMDADEAQDAATELYVWAKRIVSGVLGSPRTMTKQARLQVLPFIMALAYASRARIISYLVERDMASQECDKTRWLNRACRIVDDFISVLHKALEGLMPKTSLLEIALDYHLPMAMYLTLMKIFRAGVDAIKSPNARLETITAFDDGLSLIREALQWKPSGAGHQAQATAIALDSTEKREWWARFTNADPRAADTNNLRSSIDIREIGHVLGAASDDIAANLAPRPGKKSALLQLPPATALRAALCAAIARARQAIHADRPLPAPPQSFARISKPPPPPSTPRAAPTPTPAPALAASARLHAPTPRIISVHSGSVLALALCPCSQRLVSGSMDFTAKVLSPRSGQPLGTFSDHMQPVTCAAVSPDGKWAVSGSWEGSMCVWTLESRRVRHTLQGHYGVIKAVAVSPDGGSIASGGDDKRVKLWNADSGQCEATLTGPAEAVQSVAFSPGGSKLVSGSADKVIRVWSVHTRALECVLHGHSEGVVGVAVMPDERRLVSGSLDKTIKVWSLKSKAEEMSIEGHGDALTCMAMFPDGERIATGSEDKSVRVWNLRSGTVELTLEGHCRSVRCVAVSRDGQSVVSGSDDTMIKVWDLRELGARQG